MTRVLSLPAGQRHLVALAGPPASGKSTLAEALGQAVNTAGRKAAVVPMDGFHLDNAVLERQGLLPRKGAPETFDLRGFEALLQMIADGGRVYFPLFDRSRELSVTAAAELDSDCEIVVVEGNYLLFDQEGWKSLARFWDLSVYLNVPEDVLLDRICARWKDHGFDRAAALAKAEENDLPNALRVQKNRLRADMVLPHTG